MSISLLYRDIKNKKSDAKVSLSMREVIYNLNIDKVTQSACQNKKSAEYFLHTLCNPLDNISDIKYRNEILKDFIEMPSLLNALILLFKSFDNLQNENKEMTDEIFRYGIPVSLQGLMDCTYEQLYINAHFARRVIAYFSELHDCFSEYDVKSEGLAEMKNYCAKMIKDSNIEKVESIAESFKNETVDKYNFTINAEFDEILNTVSCTISEISDKKNEKENIIKRLFKKKTDIPEKIDISSAAADNSAGIITESMAALSDIFHDISVGIYNTFYGIGDELQFYFTACELEKYISSNGMHYSYPEVLAKEENCYFSEDLYDPLLLNEGKNQSNIVTNSLNIPQECAGILAKGDNNCGKTSFLRSVGYSVIFAQGGLFVCAKNLRLSLRSGIFTHFSSAEKELSDDAAGRFEGEVKDIVKIMDNIRPYSLLMLNETFQTTAYQEGAQGMKTILDILPLLNIKYIFVTHMQTMFSICQDENILKLKAGEGKDKYKMIPADTEEVS